VHYQPNIKSADGGDNNPKPRHKQPDLQLTPDSLHDWRAAVGADAGAVAHLIPAFMTIYQGHILILLRQRPPYPKVARDFQSRAFRQVQEIVRLFAVRLRFEVFIAVLVPRHDHVFLISILIDDVIHKNTALGPRDGVCLRVLPSAPRQAAANGLDALIRVLPVSFVDAFNQ
jgi:hypothetical protein